MSCGFNTHRRNRTKEVINCKHVWVNEFKAGENGYYVCHKCNSKMNRGAIWIQ